MPRIALAVACFILALLTPALAAAGQESSPPPAAPAGQEPAAPETEAAEPVAPPEENGEPATLLTPRFEVGQRVVLRQTSRNPKRGEWVYPRIVHVDVLARDGADVVMRWRTVEMEMPVGLTEAEKRVHENIVSDGVSPALDLLFREGEGLVGLHDWERARDEWLEFSEQIVKRVPQLANDPVAVEKALAKSRERMKTREGTEATLLKDFRAYFDGAYHEVLPGEEVRDSVEIANVLAGDGSTIPMDRVFHCVADAANEELLTLTMVMTPDPAAWKRIMKGVLDELPEDNDPEEIPDLGEMEQRVEMSWTLDRRIGWPVAVRDFTRVRFGEHVFEAERTWTLIEGPTKPAR